MSKSNKYSHGILCLNNKSQVLLLKRKFTYEFSYIIEGNLGRLNKNNKYNNNNNIRCIYNHYRSCNIFNNIVSSLEYDCPYNILFKVNNWNTNTVIKLLNGITKEEAENLLKIIEMDNYDDIINEMNILIPFEFNTRNFNIFMLSIMYIKMNKECVSLLKKVSNESVNKQLYILPAGREDKQDKNSFNTAIREFNEETGLKQKDIFISNKNNPITINIRSYEVNYIYKYYISYINIDKVNDVVVDNKEVISYEWFDINKLYQINFNKKIIEHLDNHIMASYKQSNLIL